MPEAMPITADELAALQAAGLGDLGARLLQRIERDRQEIDWRDAKLEKLTFEMAQLKRMKFGKRSEQLDAEQKVLFDEAVDADIAATEDRLKELLAGKKPPKVQGERPKREALPPGLPRVDRHHEPENKTCTCGCALKRIGEDVSEKLDYTPGVFTVERHIRGKWACSQCRTLMQAPVPAEIIDKGIPTSGLLAQVLVAKHTPITFRSTVRKPSSDEPAWRYRARRSARGSACADFDCSLWSTRSRSTCCAARWCMPTRRRWRCWPPAAARPTGPTSGPMRAGAFEPLKRGGLRLHRDPRRRARTSLPRRLAR